MNTYITLDIFKSSGVLNIAGTGDDARLLSALEGASRMVDRYCNRHFYVLNATRVFDGNGGLQLLLPDLVAVDEDGVKTDDNRDRSFETTWAETDYLLLPSNADPANSANPASRPYTGIEVDVMGTKAAWPAGRRTVQITGQWGYRRHVRRATETMDAVADATTTSVSVSERADVQAGHTLLVDDEQVYVRSYSGDTLTITRGVNGTTAAVHTGGAAIDIYEYPGPVVEAVIIQAARLWKRKDSAFAHVVGMPGGGQMPVTTGIDPDAHMLLGPFRRIGA